MRLKELLRTDNFASAKLLTGNIGLENEIESVMVLEAIDIEKWSKTHQIILTSFYAFANQPIEKINDFFQKMEKIGISGLIVKVDRLISMIPEWMIELCIQHRIPLIKITQDISYEKIMLGIYQPIFNYQSHILKTYYEVRQRFSQLTRNFASLERIMAEFYQLLQKSCFLQIPERQIFISEGNVDRDLVITSQERYAHSAYTTNNYSLIHFYTHRDARDQLALQVRIPNNFTENCSLFIFNNEEEFKENDLMIIENVVDVLQEKLQMEYLIKKDRYTRLNNLADAILQNTPQYSDELDSLLQEANLAKFTSYQGIAFATNSLNSKVIQKEIRNKLRHLKPNTLFFEHMNYLIVLLNFSKEGGPISKELLHQLLADYFVSYPELTIAVSELKEREQLKEILLDCLNILRFNEEYFIDNVVEMTDLGIFRYFIEENKQAEMAHCIPQELRQLQREQFDLFATLQVYFQQNRNYKKTAEALFLHPKTIRYRLDRIQEILGIDLTNPLQAHNYETGCYLLNLKKRRAQLE